MSRHELHGRSSSHRLHLQVTTWVFARCGGRPVRGYRLFQRRMGRIDWRVAMEALIRFIDAATFSGVARQMQVRSRLRPTRPPYSDEQNEFARQDLTERQRGVRVALREASGLPRRSVQQPDCWAIVGSSRGAQAIGQCAKGVQSPLGRLLIVRNQARRPRTAWRDRSKPWPCANLNAERGQ